MKPCSIALVSLAALSLTAAAKPPAAGAAPKHECFWARNVTSFQAVDESHVNILVGAHDVWAMTMFGPCHEVDWAHQVALESHGGSMICSPLDADLISPSSFGTERCPVKEIRHLTAAEVEALPKKERP